MHDLKNIWFQLALVAVVGTGVGLVYKQHRQAELDWHKSHSRLNETVSFPMLTGIPFGKQFFLDAEGMRIDVPPPDNREIDYRGATWWSIEDTGRMHLWNQDRVEVWPKLL